MTRTMVPQAPRFVPVRRLLDTVLPSGGDADGEHLHYDRGARVWRTHAELDRPAALALDAAATAELQEVA